jgi:hypothetical protein
MLKEELERCIVRLGEGHGVLGLKNDAGQVKGFFDGPMSKLSGRVTFSVGLGAMFSRLVWVGTAQQGNR